MFRLVSVMDTARRKRECRLAVSLFELLYSSWRTHIYHIIDFQAWHIPFLEILNISLTVTWTYLDVFIMMISLGIQDLFETFNVRMERSQNKVAARKVAWQHFRNTQLPISSNNISALPTTRCFKLSLQKMPSSFWIEMRTHFVILNNLVEFVDEHIALLIVLSFASNLYFICLQLFNSFIK